MRISLNLRRHLRRTLPSPLTESLPDDLLLGALVLEVEVLAPSQ